jgi:hypothetical protein
MSSFDDKFQKALLTLKRSSTFNRKPARETWQRMKARHAAEISPVHDAASLVAEAERQMAAYPQYRDHWRDYVTGVMRRDVRTKLGQAFRKGETVLVNPTPGPHQTPGFLTAWSMSNKVDTSIRANDVSIREGKR